jgi:hypothetical protein
MMAKYDLPWAGSLKTVTKLSYHRCEKVKSKCTVFLKIEATTDKIAL